MSQMTKKTVKNDESKSEKLQKVLKKADLPFAEKQAAAALGKNPKN